MCRFFFGGMCAVLQHEVFKVRNNNNGNKAAIKFEAVTMEKAQRKLAKDDRLTSFFRWFFGLSFSLFFARVCFELDIFLRVSSEKK